MKKLTATAAIALALVSGAAFAERGSAELNAIAQPSSSANHQAEDRSASVEQLITRNSSAGDSMVRTEHTAGNSHQNASHATSVSQLQARNGATGEQTPNATSDVHPKG